MQIYETFATMQSKVPKNLHKNLFSPDTYIYQDILQE